MDCVSKSVKSVSDAVTGVVSGAAKALTGGMKKHHSRKHHSRKHHSRKHHSRKHHGRKHHKKGGSSCGTHKKRGGSVLAKAALPFGLLGLQRLMKTRKNRAIRRKMHTRKARKH